MTKNDRKPHRRERQQERAGAVSPYLLKPSGLLYQSSFSFFSCPLLLLHLPCLQIFLPSPSPSPASQHPLHPHLLPPPAAPAAAASSRSCHHVPLRSDWWPASLKLRVWVMSASLPFPFLGCQSFKPPAIAFGLLLSSAVGPKISRKEEGRVAKLLKLTYFSFPLNALHSPIALACLPSKYFAFTTLNI